MLHQKSHLSIKAFCTSASKSLAWRTQIQNKHLALQVSSILLQRRNWVPLLRSLNLSHKLTPSLLLQILHKTRPDPQISISFFNWARQNVGFATDLKSHCQIIEIAVGSGLYRPAKPLLGPLLQSEPTATLVEALVQACRGKGSQAHVLSFVLEAYANRGLFAEGLEFYKKIRVLGVVPLGRASSALLNALEQANEVNCAWCFLSSAIRSGVSVDNSTWAVVARIHCKNGKFDRVSRLLDNGVYSSAMYNLIIESYSERGDIAKALHRLNELCDRSLDGSFSTHSSILDGACKYGDLEVIQRILTTMAEKGLLSICPSEFDSTILKFCDLGKTYAAEMFYRRATSESVALKDVTYGCLLRALSWVGRVKEAVEMYHTISKGEKIVNSKSCNEFVSVLCREDIEEACDLLKDIIQRGFSPCTDDLSKFITSQCSKGRWPVAEELLNVILEKGFLPDFVCCCSLVEHFCNNRQIGSAIVLHDKIVKLNGRLDLATYNVLLNALVAERKIEVAARVFDYMRKQNLLSSDSFSILIRGLCKEKELGGAMKLHDEMLELGLKPNISTYKRLIMGFK